MSGPLNIDRPLLSVKALPEGAISSTAVDLSDRILGLDYLEELKKADKLSLRLDNWDLSFFDDATFRKGTILEVTWGYPKRTITRRVIVERLRGGREMTVECDSPVMMMHRLHVTKTWEEMSLASVARSIAAKYSDVFRVQGGTMGTNIDVPNDVIKTRVQSAETDASFLVRHARKRGLEFYVDGQGLHYKLLNLTQAPVKELAWFNGDGDLLDFSIDNDVRSRPGAVVVKGFDPLTKKTITHRADNSSTRRAGLAPVIEIIDPRTGDGTIQRRVGEEHIVPSSETDPRAIKAQAEGKFRQTQLNTVELSFKTVGQPDLLARRVVVFSGLGKRFSGRYTTTQVRHQIDNGGYIVSGRAKSDGTGGYGQGNARSKANVTKVTPRDNPSSSKQIEIVDPRTGETHTEFRKSTEEGNKTGHNR